MTKKKPTRPALTEQIRCAMRDSGLMMIEICRATDIEPAVLSRFMNGKAGMNLKTLDRIAELLELRIVSDHSGKKKQKPKEI